MKFVAQLKRVGETIVIQTPYEVNLDDGRYSIEITEVGNKRTSLQNSYLWKLIREISKVENGGSKEDDCQAIYINILRMTGVKYRDIEAPTEAIQDLKVLYRDIVVLNEDNGRATIRAYFGTSTMNTKEMSEVINTAIDYAERLGINTDYWMEVFYGKA